MAVIQRCRTCGFDIPGDGEGCPGCGVPAVPSRAAHQAAGLALPTRSVHPLPHVRPRSEHDLRPLPPPRTARSAFSFTSAFVVVTLAAATLAWLASQPRFALTVPDGTVDLLDDITTASATASITALLIGLVAMVVWSLRASGRAIRTVASRRHR